MPRIYLSDAQIDALLRLCEWGIWYDSRFGKALPEEEQATLYREIKGAIERLIRVAAFRKEGP